MKKFHLLTLFALLTAPAFAVDGVVLINQSIAMAGDVAPGDTPGFPVTISVPGSYRLSGNLVVPDLNTTAILITTSNVRLDLNGFSILGPNVCAATSVASTCGSGTGIGINDNAAGAARSVSVSNGVISGLGNAGIYLNGSGDVVEKVRTSANGSAGIVLVGDATTVSSCTAYANGGVGISAPTVIGSNSFHNFSDGIDVFALALNNVTTYNTAAGLSAGVAATLVGNTSTNNGTGISVTCPSLVSGNTVSSNGFDLLESFPSCLLVNNLVGP